MKEGIIIKDYLVIGCSKIEAELIKNEILEYHSLRCGIDKKCFRVRAESLRTIKNADAISFKSRVRLTEGALLNATEEELVFIKKLADDLRNKAMNEYITK